MSSERWLWTGYRDKFCGIHTRKTHCIHGHEFTEENTYHPTKRPEGRYCRQCKRDKDKAYYEAKKKGDSNAADTNLISR